MDIESQTVRNNDACGCLGRMKKKRKKPSRRFGHVAVAVEGYMVVWGGGMHGGLFLEERYIHSSEVWIYHIDTEKWYQLPTYGDILPPGMSGSTAVSVGHCMFIIGGHTASGSSNDVWVLDLRCRKWTKVKIDSDLEKPSPRDKFVAWEYNNSIYIFGGFGLPTQGYLHETGDFYVDANSWQPVRGWNNQLLAFDISSQTWTNPTCHGCVPSPRAAHAAARLGSSVYVFGGRHCNKRLNDLYKLNLVTNVWTCLSIDSSSAPCARSWHTLTAISDKHIFLYGGYAQDGEALSDAWLLDTDALTWQKLVVPKNKPRLWHTAVCSYDSDVLIFGGCCNDILHPTEPTVQTNELITYRCSPKSLLRLCLDSVHHQRDKLRPEWNSLPKPLAEILHLRSDYAESTPRFSSRNSGVKICCVS